jgi:hypothetical protein
MTTEAGEFMQSILSQIIDRDIGVEAWSEYAGVQRLSCGFTLNFPDESFLTEDDFYEELEGIRFDRARKEFEQ